MLYDTTGFTWLRYQITAKLKFITKKNVAYWNSASAAFTSSDKQHCHTTRKTMNTANVLQFSQPRLLHMLMQAVMF